MGNRLKFSICIPAYNGERYIARAIRSGLNQTYNSKYEIIVIDDASIDNTEKIVKSFTDNRIKYHKNKKNLGMVRNWNKCMLLANGEYILLLHQDDALCKEILEIEANILDNHKEIGLVGTNERFIIKRKGFLYREIRTARDYFKRLLIHYLNNPKNIITYKKGNIKEFIMQRHYFPCSSVAIRKSVFNSIGGFFEDFPYSADEEYWSRILLHYDICRIKENYIYRYMHDKNTEYSTWEKIDFPEKYLCIYLKLWEYSKYDQDVLSFLTDKWLRAIKGVKQYCISQGLSPGLITHYDKYIISIENHKKEGISIYLNNLKFQKLVRK